MKKSIIQNKIDISENVTMPNPENSTNQPVSALIAPGQIKKIAKNKPMLVSAKDSDNAPLDVPYSQGL